MAPADSIIALNSIFGAISLAAASFQEAFNMCAGRCFWTQIWLAVVSGKSIENVAEDFGYSVDYIASIVNRYMDAYVRQTGALPQRWRQRRMAPTSAVS